MIPFFDMQAMNDEVRVELDKAWHEATSTGRFIGGPSVERFEARWAEYCETRHCVGLGSGTVALQLALVALRIGAGDDVIVPANTFIATAAAVVATGARPVFVDVDPATLLITAEAVRAALTRRTAAIVVVHLYGQPANMDAIKAVASSAGVAVIEDAAQAHGATWKSRKAGSLSDVGCFSFYPGKNLGAFGDAGAIVTNDAALADKVRALSNHGRRHDDPYRHDLIGGTHRLDALQAALLSVKLARLDDWNAGRRRAMAIYATELADVPVELVATDRNACGSHHLAVIQTAHRAVLRRALTDAGIATGIHYPIPCHLQPPFATVPALLLPVAERAAERVLSLPLFPHLPASHIAQIAEVIRRTLATVIPDATRSFRAA